MSLSLVTAFVLSVAPADTSSKQMRSCPRQLRAAKTARSITSTTWRWLDDVTPDPRVLASLDAQPEFTLPIWDYFAVMVDQERIDDGCILMHRYRTTLERVSRRYGVDPATVVAVWGVESNFGKGRGAYHILRSLATLSCNGRRQTYFRKELLSALRIVQGGHVAPADFLGSWAGAFGQTQFMPSTFERLAVDFDRDGKRDLMDNVPDALAPTASYLRNAGWRRGAPWGLEVRLPTADGAPFSTKGEGRKVKRPLTVWAAHGVTRVDGMPLAADGLSEKSSAGLLLPARIEGPAFLVMRNFDAVYSYNAAVSYALTIVHLADRLRGLPPFAAPWPTDDLGLSRGERRELQWLLAQHGHDIGPPDGILGRERRSRRSRNASDAR
jgi:lytic murein transglycosylase